MRVVCDIHISRKIVRWLCENGFDAIHANDLMGTDRASDPKIANRADETAASVITEDQTLTRIVRSRQVPRLVLALDDPNARAPQIIEGLRPHLALPRELLASPPAELYLWYDRSGGLMHKPA